MSDSLLMVWLETSSRIPMPASDKNTRHLLSSTSTSLACGKKYIALKKMGLSSPINRCLGKKAPKKVERNRIE